MKNIGIVGAGAWGTAIAIACARSGNKVTLWSFDGEHAQFDGVELSENIMVTSQMSDLANTDTWLVVTPAAFFRETIRRAAEFYNNQPIIICTKGIEPGTHKLMSEILEKELPSHIDYGVLSGPQFAAEVATGIPTGSTLAGTPAAREAGHIALRDLYLAETDDVIGAEICGIGKNAVALIMGYASVAASGENERAMTLTRAWGDVVTFGLANGAKIESFLALCGIGDLFLSATSKTSRNFSAGAAIARGDQIVGTVEGISALNGLVYRAHEQDLDLSVLKDMKLLMNIA